MDKTPKKRPVKPFNGAADGKPFTTENQPSPEAKSAGWEQRRKERLFTGEVWEQLVGNNGLPLKEFTKKMIKLAEGGNTKAIEKVLGAIEEETVKIDTTGEMVIRIIRDNNV